MFPATDERVCLHTSEAVNRRIQSQVRFRASPSGNPGLRHDRSAFRGKPDPGSWLPDLSRTIERT